MCLDLCENLKADVFDIYATGGSYDHMHKKHICYFYLTEVEHPVKNRIIPLTRETKPVFTRIKYLRGNHGTV